MDSWIFTVAYCFALWLSRRFACCNADITYYTVSTAHGKLRGKVDVATGVPVARFLGIQYAKPPTGPLRFMPPAEPDPDPWTSTKDALHFGKECPQTDLPGYPFGNATNVRSEDCLYLNVYTPVTNTSNMAVMVWIHGGGYFVGAGTHYDVTAMATKGVVMVTINYRLDVLGFLTTEDDVIPGNYGLLDQIAALRWVHENIAAFGGDPKQVTVFGESAGAFSASILTLSPLAKGLFQRAIMQSGSSLSSAAVQHPGDRVSGAMTARLVAAAAGCEDLNNSTGILLCLQSTDVQNLLDISSKIGKAREFWSITLPRVETAFGVLPDLPVELLKRGEFNDVDCIYGFNAQETGSDPALFSNLTLTQAVNHFLRQFPQTVGKRIFAQFESLYITNGDHDPHSPISNYIQMEDDLIFKGPAMTEISYKLSNSPKTNIYLYQFEHRPSFSKLPAWVSAVHGDEARYVLDIQYRQRYDQDFVPSGADTAVSRQMVDMWTTFAKQGKPLSQQAGSASWDAFDTTSLRYLKINTTSKSSIWLRSYVVPFYKNILHLVSSHDVPYTSLLTR